VALSSKWVELRVWQRVGGIAVPLLVAQSVDFLVQIGIVAIMGAMGDDALYLRSLYQPIAFLLLALSMAFAVSNQVTAAISKGAGRPQDVLASAGSLARIWFLSGAVVCLVLAVAAPWIAVALGVQAHLVDSYASFLRWTAASGLLVIGPALCASCLRGYGHVGRATVVMLSAAAVRIGCVAGLGLGVRSGVMAVPVAEATAGLAGLAVGVVMLRRTELWRLDRLRVWQPEVLGRLRQIGTPIATSFLIISVYTFAVVRLLSRFGEQAVGGFSVASALQDLALLPGMMLGTATAIVVNQQRGAGDFGRVRASLRGGLGLSVAVYAVVSVLIWTMAWPLAELLTSDAGIAGEAAGYLGVVGLTFVVQGPVLAVLTVMEHTGSGFVAVGLNAIYFALIVVVAVLAAGSLDGSAGLYLVIAGCNLIGVTVPLFALRYLRRLSAGAVPA